MSSRARLMVKMAEKKMLQPEADLDGKQRLVDITKLNTSEIVEKFPEVVVEAKPLEVTTNHQIDFVNDSENYELEEFVDFEDSGSEYIPDSDSTDSSILSPSYSPFSPRIKKKLITTTVNQAEINLSRTNESQQLGRCTSHEAESLPTTTNEAQVTYSTNFCLENQSHGTIITTPVSRKRQRTEIRKGPGRKRKANEKEWKVQQIKAAYNKGIEHKNSRGRVIPARKMGPGCKSSCRLNCLNKITLEDRQQQFDRFWAIGNITLQREYILRKTKSTAKQTSKIVKTYERVGNKIYYLSKPGSCEAENNIRVCKTMFMDTLGINRQWIATIFLKMDNDRLTPDMRGKFTRKLTDEKARTAKSVIDHINMFPKIESHYIRKNSQREYLVGDLSISEMYRMYVEWAENENVTRATKRQYADIFNNQFNLSFFIPKKDRCNDCASFENQNLNRDEGVFAEHVTEAKLSRQIKEDDKKASIGSNGRILTIVFNFQKILTCPNADISTFYYKRNFNSYNFTVYCITTKEAYCYVWHECIAKRGPNEVVSCLQKFIEMHFNKNKQLEEIRFWSDNCYHQNKNKILISFFSWAANKYNIKITQRYLTKGHTQNEGDSVHSTIEKRKKLREVMIPQEWYEIIRFAKVSEPFYKVVEMTQNDFYDFKPLSDMANFNQDNFQISKLKEFQISNIHPLTISYKKDWNSTQEQIILITEGKNRGRKAVKNPQAFKNFIPGLCYEEPLPITSAKWKDLNSLCEMNLINQKYHNFYSSLPVTETILNNDNEDDE